MRHNPLALRLLYGTLSFFMAIGAAAQPNVTWPLERENNDPENDPYQMKLSLAYSEIPPDQMPMPMHLIGVKADVFQKRKGGTKKVGVLKPAPFDEKRGISPGLIGLVTVSGEINEEIELYAIVTHRDGWNLKTATLKTKIYDLRNFKPVAMNEWVKDLPPLPWISPSECKGITHNTLGPRGCPEGTKATARIKDLMCPCICCEKINDIKK